MEYVYNQLSFVESDRFDGLALVSAQSDVLERAEIPAFVEGRRVVEIGPRAFAGLRLLKTVVLGAYVSEIDPTAFDDADALERIEKSPENTRFESIDGVLCDLAGKLLRYPEGKRDEEYVTPRRVVAIGAGAFRGARYLRGLECRDRVASVGARAFSGAKVLARIRLGSLACDLAEDAFGEKPGSVVVAPGGSYAEEWARSVGAPVEADLSELFGYVLTDEGACVVGLSSSFFETKDFDGVLRIPHRIDGRLVTSIGSKAFVQNDQIRFVVFPDGVKFIGQSAFRGCVNLERVFFPTELERIGARAFKECRKLESMDFNAKLRRIDESAFNHCESARSATFPAGIERIEARAFLGCRSLDEIEIAGEFATIGDEAFAECVSLRSVVLREGLRALGADAFYRCRSLSSIIVPASITTISPGLFSNCESLRDVKLADSVTVIGAKAFKNCRSLSDFAMPSGLRVLENSAFENCSSHGFASIRIPGGVKTIGRKAFCNCRRLARVEFAKGLERIETKAFLGCSTLQTIRFPRSLKSIGAFAFARCRLLCRADGTLALPARLELIGDGAFGECESIETFRLDESNAAFYLQEGGLYSHTNALVAIPTGTKAREYVVKEGTASIRPCAFLGTQVASVEIPSTVSEIGDLAFWGCNQLAELSVPRSVQTIGERAFSPKTRLIYHSGSAVEDWANENLHAEREVRLR